MHCKYSYMFACIGAYVPRLLVARDQVTSGSGIFFCIHHVLVASFWLPVVFTYTVGFKWVLHCTTTSYKWTYACTDSVKSLLSINTYTFNKISTLYGWLYWILYCSTVLYLAFLIACTWNLTCESGITLQFGPSYS